jgi:hypothetical protein
MIGMNNWKIELVCSASIRHFSSLLIFILGELETLLRQTDSNGSISERGSEPYSDGKGNNPIVGQRRVPDTAYHISNFLST